jgi:hypothetical protein
MILKYIALKKVYIYSEWHDLNRLKSYIFSQIIFIIVILMLN